MRRFMINTGRYGGELVVGRISEEFFNELQDFSEEQIIERFLTDEISSWYEFNDIEHLSGPFADSQYQVTEIDTNEDEIAYKGEYNYNGLYSREAYMYDGAIIAPPAGDTPALQLVVQMFSSEKGVFGDIIIETEDDFDPDKLCVSVLETDLAEIVDRYYYDGKELLVNRDFDESIEKGFYATVGNMNMKHHDHRSDYDEGSEYLDEAFEYYEV